MCTFWTQSTKCVRSISNIVHIFVELVFLLLLSQGGNILLIVKAFNSSLICRQKYSLYWFIHSIRETPFLGILTWVKTLTRAWSIERLFSAANGRNSPCSGGLIIISDVKHTSRLWNSEQCRVTSWASSEQMRLPVYCLFTTWRTAATQAAVVLASCTAIWPDQTSW